jgi:hypothetical protein
VNTGIEREAYSIKKEPQGGACRRGGADEGGGSAVSRGLVLPFTSLTIRYWQTIP